ncbi:MAG: pyruvate ferredoxin oxidoreductase [Deltaproteobacteria bacterium CG11_big_fil_rev_8_21_14_0_20_49_13]|nr:MAG: pyruvate ferredoxin oxidoreductase [Deltaproteobacteria bacterium CG11_big_fil_rev_8_21_14_0_20_49_13]
MKINDIVIGMVGAGGDGVVAFGDILSTTSALEGLNCMVVKSFGPQIRGGESSCKIRIAEKEVYSQGDRLDVLVAFNWDDYAKFPGELDVKKDVVVVCDAKNTPDKLPFAHDINPKEVFRVPFDELVKESGNPKAKNIISLGVISEILNLPKDGLKKSITRKFGKKKQEILESNIRAIDIGINYAAKNNLKASLQFEYKLSAPKYVATGNDALAYGALAAGCKFLASYPITPASEIMEWMGRELPKFGGTMVQAEDEIAAVCMVTGAAFGGVKAMTSTSGPGVSLKIEAIGLGTIAELPYVVVNVQRGGPATGLPTKSEQSDLWQAIGGMHGDAPHAVIAPADVADCFDVGIHAFGIAEKYQMPVIVLSDQFIGHRKETVSGFDTGNIRIVSRETPSSPSRGDYKRFADTKTGVSPMSYPGIKGGEYTCSGIEHEESGSPTARHDTHERMCAKRARKLETLVKDFSFIRRYGPKKAKVGILAWGSTKGVVREAVEAGNAGGMSISALVPQLIYPLQADLVNEFIASCEKIMIVEMNYTGQFKDYLAGKCNLPRDVIHMKSSGAMFFEVGDILKRIKEACL